MDFGLILVAFWLNYDWIMTEFWLNYDFFLTSFWLLFDFILTYLFARIFKARLHWQTFFCWRSKSSPDKTTKVTTRSTPRLYLLKIHTCICGNRILDPSSTSKLVKIFARISTFIKRTQNRGSSQNAFFSQTNFLFFTITLVTGSAEIDAKNKHQQSKSCHLVFSWFLDLIPPII